MYFFLFLLLLSSSTTITGKITPTSNSRPLPIVSGSILPPTTPPEADDDYDDESDQIGNTPQLASDILNTVIEDGDKGESSAVDIMRLMRGGRGRKSVLKQHNPKPELKHCYSAEPGGQRGYWKSSTNSHSLVPIWQNNQRCTGLKVLDIERAVKCIMQAGDHSNIINEPVWLTLVGDLNIWLVYQCFTGMDVSSECKMLGNALREKGYERLQFPIIPTQSVHHNVQDSDTFFWPPNGHSLPPIRISFRRFTSNKNGGILLSSNGTTRDWNEMYDQKGNIRAKETWLANNGIKTFGRVPTSLLFSTGAPNVLKSDSKDCTLARHAGQFLKGTDRIPIQRQLWVSVGGISTKAQKKKHKSFMPTNQHLLWDAECSRMQAKLHKIPFVDIAARTTSALNQDTLSHILQNDGTTIGPAIIEDIVRNWMPFLCHELKKVIKK